MIWIEILSRHRDITARFRIAGPEACVGRGYDNDVIVDDPYVAAQHLRIFRDETGRLVAEDMGSANGLFLDAGKSRQARIIVDGSHPIRIGQTFLRIRETNHAVECERVARPEWRIFPIAAVAV
jgi:pSer/pThr/pTyr-binding forkhead associated (FHA) protein